MSVIIEEKENSKVLPDTEDIEYKIEIATQTLERNIGFVTNCDNKTSIVLAVFGVLLTIILTNEGLNEIFSVVKTCIEIKTSSSILYLLCFVGTILVMAWGMFNLGSVLVAKTSEEAIGRKDESSRIFFAGIRKSGSCNAYCQRFYAMSKEDILNDLVEQIYINADIAVIKYTSYNLGLRRTSIGFILFVVLLLIGSYIY